MKNQMDMNMWNIKRKLGLYIGVVYPEDFALDAQSGIFGVTGVTLCGQALKLTDHPHICRMVECAPAFSPTCFSSVSGTMA